MSSPSDITPHETRHDPYEALRIPAYRQFIIGRVAFLVGSQMQGAAVAWQIYEMLGSKLALGYIGLIQIIPFVVLALPAGQLADRVSRKGIVLWGQLLFFLCSLGMAWASWSHASPSVIYALLFMLAVGRVFAMPALNSLLPTIVPRHALPNAANWGSTVFELSGTVGPAVGGLLIAASGGATAVYLMAACSALICSYFFLRLKPAQLVSHAKAASWSDLLGGIRFVFRTKLLLAAAGLDLFAVLLGGATALLPVVARDILHVGPAGFGWLRAAPSIGAVSMALLTAHMTPWKHAGKALFTAVIGFGVAIIIFGFSENYWLSFAMLIVTGVCDNVSVVIRQTLVQLITPDQMRGRVSAVNLVFIGCSNELGAFESGLTAQFFGTVPAIVGGGVGPSWSPSGSCPRPANSEPLAK